MSNYFTAYGQLLIRDGLADCLGLDSELSYHVGALKGKASWQLGADEYHKVTQHNKLHINYIGKSTRGWLSLLGPETAKS